MSQGILVSVDERSYGWLRHASNEHRRTLEDLATAAVEEAALAYAKSQGLVEINPFADVQRGRSLFEMDRRDWFEDRPRG